MLDKRDIGRWVRIQFWDHCILNPDLPVYRKKKEPILCEVAGLIREVTAQKITLATWWVHDDKKTVSDNVEHVVIVRSGIQKYAWAEALKWHED